MTWISEAEACRWLGQTVSLIAPDGGPTATGRMQHVSSRSVFLLVDGAGAPTVRLIPLMQIQQIVGTERREATP